MDTILAVEDSLVFQAQLQDILQDGYRLLVRDDGLAGIAAATTEPPDIILLDVNLPGMNGFDVCRTLKVDARTAEIPIIFLTSCSAGDEKVRGFEAGADDYIVKPFYPEELIARIGLHLSSRREKRMALELERLKLLREMAVALSHELNNPLTSILGYLHLSAKKVPKGQVAEYLDQIKLEAEKIARIVAKLSDVTQDATTNYLLDEEMIDLERI